jgi:hypothetical protein
MPILVLFWFARRFYNIGDPNDSVVRFETTIKAGKYVIVAHGTADEVANDKKVI